VEYIARMMPILAVAFVFDDLQGVLSGKYTWFFKQRKFGKYSEHCGLYMLLSEHYHLHNDWH
jgi:hypothetical protein